MNTKEKALLYRILLGRKIENYELDRYYELLDSNQHQSCSETKRFLEKIKDVIESGESALANYEHTGMDLVSGRAHHVLELHDDGIYARGQTCCHTRQYGCAYLATCKATSPASGLLYRKIR